MPSEFTGGSAKLAGLKLYQRFAGAVEPTEAGVAFAGSHRVARPAGSGTEGRPSACRSSSRWELRRRSR